MFRNTLAAAREMLLITFFFKERLKLAESIVGATVYQGPVTPWVYVDVRKPGRHAHADVLGYASCYHLEHLVLIRSTSLHIGPVTPLFLSLLVDWLAQMSQTKTGRSSCRAAKAPPLASRRAKRPVGQTKGRPSHQRCGQYMRDVHQRVIIFGWQSAPRADNYDSEASDHPLSRLFCVDKEPRLCKTTTTKAGTENSTTTVQPSYLEASSRHLLNKRYVRSHVFEFRVKTNLRAPSPWH